VRSPRSRVLFEISRLVVEDDFCVRNPVLKQCSQPFVLKNSLNAICVPPMVPEYTCEEQALIYLASQSAKRADCQTMEKPYCNKPLE
jgi:hypothetical protein